MKKLISVFLAAVMTASVMSVPVFAYEPERRYDDCIYGIEYNAENPSTVRSVDEYGQKIFVKGTIFNNGVFPLSDAPKMEHTKKIGNVTFSNYIKHNEKTLRDSQRENINVIQVYVGIGASMRSDVDNVEFLRSPGGGFNFRDDIFSKHIAGIDVPFTSDLVHIKTNTPGASGTLPFIGPQGFMGYTARYAYLDYYYIRPYTDGGRNMDGTWKKGLTWVFEENPDVWKNGRYYYEGQHYEGDYYLETHPIRVEYKGTTTYYQVIVMNKTNYADLKAPAATTKPVPAETTPAATATAKPTSSKVYVNGKETAFDAYNINGNNYFKLRDIAYAINGTEKQFAVGWDGEKNAISLTSKTPYTGNGGSVSSSRQQRTATGTNSAIYVDGTKTDFTAYQIQGNNFFKLRDLGATFDFNVGWDSTTQSVTIDTTKGYQ